VSACEEASRLAALVAREGVLNKLSPALGAGKERGRIFVAAEAATTKWLVQRETL
jgi:hypothetical protein